MPESKVIKIDQIDFSKAKNPTLRKKQIKSKMNEIQKINENSKTITIDTEIDKETSDELTAQFRTLSPNLKMRKTQISNFGATEYINTEKFQELRRSANLVASMNQTMSTLLPQG